MYVCAKSNREWVLNLMCVLAPTVLLCLSTVL